MAPWLCVRWEEVRGVGGVGWPFVWAWFWAGEGVGSAVLWLRAWRERNWATSSVLSFAAFTARVVGIVRREAAKAPIASCSLEPCARR